MYGQSDIAAGQKHEDVGEERAIASERLMLEDPL